MINPNNEDEYLIGNTTITISRIKGANREKFDEWFKGKVNWDINTVWNDLQMIIAARYKPTYLNVITDVSESKTSTKRDRKAKNK